MILLVVYRPPPNKKNGSSVVDFFKEFADILNIYATLPDELVIVGDFNFNFDINIRQVGYDSYSSAEGQLIQPCTGHR